MWCCVYCVLTFIHLEVPTQTIPNLKGWGHFQIMDSVLSVVKELRGEKRWIISAHLFPCTLSLSRFLLNNLVLKKITIGILVSSSTISLRREFRQRRWRRVTCKQKPRWEYLISGLKRDLRIYLLIMSIIHPFYRRPKKPRLRCLGRVWILKQLQCQVFTRSLLLLRRS